MLDMRNPHKGFSILLIMFFGLIALEGCVELQNIQTEQEITQAIDKYQSAESKVNLGDNKKEVLAILQPTQANLSGQLKRAPEHWIDPKSGKGVDLYYFRSGWVQDGRLSDEELTPYLFIDNTLVAIGWNGLRSLANQPQSSSQKLERNPNSNSLESKTGKNSGLLTSPRGETFLNPNTPNAYGQGINSGATGKPFTYLPDFGGSGYPDPTLDVTPNAYGPGVGMDQYGRPVRPRSWP
jgi:hypothetical protein